MRSEREVGGRAKEIERERERERVEGGEEGGTHWDGASWKTASAASSRLEHTANDSGVDDTSLGVWLASKLAGGLQSLQGPVAGE